MIRPTLVAAALVGLLSMGVTRHTSLDGRLHQLEEALAARARTQDDVVELEVRVGDLARALADARAEAAESGAATESLAAELTAVRARLAEAQALLGAQDQRLATLASQSARLDALEEGSSERFSRLVNTVEATADMVVRTRSQLELVESRVAEDPSTQWRAMVAPTVQLAGETTVGSGVLLPSRPVDGDPSRFRTLVLTSWHVVRDIRADAREEGAPVPVILRDEHGEKRHFTASVVARDVALDAALLVLDSDLRLDAGVQLPTRARLRAARVFDPVVAVGCPLGNDPIPTRGHLSDLHHEVNGEEFWMISAPTYIGNSGGGLFSGTSHELLGIFTKIYTHGAIRPTVVPHMGLVTPLEQFYDWIDRDGSARVVEGAEGAMVVLRGER